VIEDPYIRLQHQIQNFVRFCETVLKAGTVKKISLITGYDDKTQLADIAEKLDELKQSLLELDVELEVKLNPNIHDREIRLDNGWVIKIGRGLDFYQKPGGWFEVGANDLTLRKCLETKVDTSAEQSVLDLVGPEKRASRLRRGSWFRASFFVTGMGRVRSAN